MFDMMDAARLEGLHLAQDPATGLKAIIAIHSTRLGPALGGCRYLPYPNDEAAIGDAIRLAQGMSYKAALAGLEQGGGKAVIIRPPHLDNRGALFEAFGRFIESLGGRYITAVDSGTSSADMDCIAQQTRHVTSTTQAGDPRRDTAPRRVRRDSRQRPGAPRQRRPGRPAGRGAGARPRRLRIGRATGGGRRRAAGLRPRSRPGATGRRAARCPSAGAGGIALHPCDILAPCGLGGVLTSQSVSQLPLRGGGRGGEQPVGAAGGRRRAGARGILYAPDYVINSGGLIYVALKHRGADPHSITAHLARIPAAAHRDLCPCPGRPPVAGADRRPSGGTDSLRPAVTGRRFRRGRQRASPAAVRATLAAPRACTPPPAARPRAARLPGVRRRFAMVHNRIDPPFTRYSRQRRSAPRRVARLGRRQRCAGRPLPADAPDPPVRPEGGGPPAYRADRHLCANPRPGSHRAWPSAARCAPRTCWCRITAIPPCN